MFKQYHGFIYPSINNKKSNKKSNKISVNSSKSFLNSKLLSKNKTIPQVQQLPATSGLPIINIQDEIPMFPANPNFKLPNIEIDDYKALLEEGSKSDIKYIPPEIIPKEEITPSRNSNKIQSLKTNIEPLTREPLTREPLTREPLIREPLIREPLIREPVIREPVTRKPLFENNNFSNLDKYRININNKERINISAKKPKKIVSAKNPEKIISAKKEFLIKTPEIILREKIEKEKQITKPKKSKKKEIKMKTVKEIKVDKEVKVKTKKNKDKIAKINKNLIKNDVLSSIEMSNSDYKDKFDELKKVYLKQHDSLVNVFNGYQKLYEKVLKEDEVKN